MRDLFGDFVVGTLVESGLSDFDVIGDGSYRVVGLPGPGLVGVYYSLDYLRAQLSLALSTEDVVEGVTAFFEKREPQWKGR